MAWMGVVADAGSTQVSAYQLGPPRHELGGAREGDGFELALGLDHVARVQVQVRSHPLELVALALNTRCLSSAVLAVRTSTCVFALYSLRNARNSSSCACNVAPSCNAPARQASDSSFAASDCA
jgi:hypothetical protein